MALTDFRDADRRRFTLIFLCKGSLSKHKSACISGHLRPRYLKKFKEIKSVYHFNKKFWNPSMYEDCKYTELTDLIIRAFYKAYNTLGYGFREKVYANALAIELRKMGLEVVREALIEVFYEGEIVGDSSADLLVEQKVIVETKAKRMLIEDHEAQLLHYLKSTIYEVGLLLNFGPEPEVKRKAYDNSRKGSLSWVKN